MTDIEAIKIALEGTENAARKLLEDDRPVESKFFYIFIALGFISQTMGIISARLEALENEDRND